MHTQRYAKYERMLEINDWPAIAELMLDSARKLANSGASFLICPDNTIHEALPPIEAASPLPWLRIADALRRKPRRKASGEWVCSVRAGRLTAGLSRSLHRTKRYGSLVEKTGVPFLPMSMAKILQRLTMTCIVNKS